MTNPPRHSTARSAQQVDTEREYCRSCGELLDSPGQCACGNDAPDDRHTRALRAEVCAHEHE